MNLSKNFGGRVRNVFESLSEWMNPFILGIVCVLPIFTRFYILTILFNLSENSKIETPSSEDDAEESEVKETVVETWTKQKLLGLSRKFNIDLVPKVTTDNIIIPPNTFIMNTFSSILQGEISLSS